MIEVRKRAPEVTQHKLKIGFLDRNLETVLSLVGRGMPELPRALAKGLLARDKILHRAAADEDLVRTAADREHRFDAVGHEHRDEKPLTVVNGKCKRLHGWM